MIELTHPDKVLFPADGITKQELARYYESVAPVMLPHVRGRPVTMERYPAGIEQKGFIQKDVSKGFPPWLERIEVPKKAGSSHYPLANDVRSLLWMANQNSITPHVWPSRLPELFQPDVCVFDLDPSRDDADELRAAALAVRALLDELGLRCWLKTSGSKGFHIVVPLDGKAGFDTVYPFAGAVGAVLVQRHPERLTQEFIKADRAGRILVDTGRNGYGATFAAVYAVRPKAGAPVSAPCTWEELESGRVAPRTFTLRTMAERLATTGDLWAALGGHAQSLRGPLEKVRALLTDEDWNEAQAARRRKPKATSAARKRPR
ncbi:MAG TPA: non-homologous end-joining DNA ligase [Polyangiaceae bacterium]